MSSIENKNFAFNEMMVHVPLCTHIEPKNILIVGSVDDEFKAEVAKHKVNAQYGDTSIINSKDEKDVDVIILNNTNIDEMLLANIQRVLKDDGILAFETESFGNDEAKLKADLALAGQNFWIAMPFKFGHNTSILASKKYHPTADIVLQVSDLLDDVNYYSTEVHSAAFVFPAYIHRKLTGIAKR
ncbi:MAG: spermidine synthase [Candidatus Marinarcus sp.]|uniref:spermine/spermidine synthase domain-containing protein n=1 Tax=Candidatus Marinarcus sp. TaxID=3100987 RepID=UPI003B00720E